jgi:aspartokinase/homoserine dehydrogenase 1
MELSYFGAEVLHPYTMMPAVERGVPIRIKNTMNPSAPGTLISHEGTATDQVITGIASIENVALINVEGGGMLGIPGVASRIFAALAAAEVNIIMISQASSEHSICIVCREEQAKKALKSLSRELAPEVEAKKISRFELLEKLEIVAVIGENMRGTPGISGRIFSALGAAEVNVLAIAQGSSERNISFVIEWKDREKALNTIHSAFFTAVNG